MTPDDLMSKGRALYGERWQTPLAHALHVSDRTMRRWLAGSSPVPEHAERQIRSVLLERFSEIGGMIAFDITPEARTVFHQYSAAAFRYDETGNLTPLTHALVAPDKKFLIEEGAKEKLRQFHENPLRAEFVRVDPNSGHPVAAPRLHGFMRGTVIIPPDIDLTAPTIDETLDAETGALP